MAARREVNRRPEEPERKSARELKKEAAVARGEREWQAVQSTVKSLSVPDLKRKLLEHTIREDLLTGLRRGTISTNAPKKIIWLCVQDDRSTHFIRLIEEELKSRGEDTKLPPTHPAEIDAEFVRQMKLIENGMRKARSN